jgi:N-acetylglucosaminyldiphosphoundecaprenol N-acetyl-beta-D-mannosaminyltransferase
VTSSELSDSSAPDRAAPAITGRRFPTCRILGVDVTPMTREGLFDAVREQIETGERCVIAHHNVHSVYLYHHDAKMREFFASAKYVFIDGAPLVRLGRLLGYATTFEHRISSVHWIRPLVRLANESGWRIYLLGGEPGQAERSARVLEQEGPRVEMRAAHGFFAPTPGHPENEAVLADIAQFRPHILCVGMGMPRQERWILENRNRIDATVVFSLGALFARLAGDLATPPLWMSRWSMEWVHRLATQPREVWRRYLIEPWWLVPYLMRDLGGRLGGRSQGP